MTYGSYDCTDWDDLSDAQGNNDDGLIPDDTGLTVPVLSKR